MLITKDGNLEKLKEYIKFRCEDCGCEFIADNSEYEYDYNQHDGESWEISCPCCRKRNYMYEQDIITKYKDRPMELDKPTTGSKAVKAK